LPKNSCRHGLRAREPKAALMTALRYDERPPDRTPINTEELPDTPTRDRNIMASAWIEAPIELLQLGVGLPAGPEAEYKRRIGEWLLWRAGPAVDADAVYLAVCRTDLTRQHRFVLAPDGSGSGSGPSGTTHGRFREWKQDLLGRNLAA
jgi:hypothetical protein